jgi:hypothetical protein
MGPCPGARIAVALNYKEGVVVTGVSIRLDEMASEFSLRLMEMGGDHEAAGWPHAAWWV